MTDSSNAIIADFLHIKTKEKHTFCTHIHKGCNVNVNNGKCLQLMQSLSLTNAHDTKHDCDWLLLPNSFCNEDSSQNQHNEAHKTCTGEANHHLPPKPWPVCQSFVHICSATGQHPLLIGHILFVGAGLGPRRHWSSGTGTWHVSQLH